MPTDAQLSVYVVSGDTAARESGGHLGHQIPQRLEIRRPFRVMRRIEGSLSRSLPFRKLQGRDLPLPYPSPPGSDTVAQDSFRFLTVSGHDVPA